jgi:hypothetical protein
MVTPSAALGDLSMKTLLAVAALTLAAIIPVHAFDDATQDVVRRHKANKPVSAADIATLMQSSERWCYAEDAGSCAWTDIYLDVTDTGATFEIGNAWSEDIDLIFTDRGTFEGSQVCEAGDDWIDSTRAINRADGQQIYGRELWALKAEVKSVQNGIIDCFDYLYRSSDDARQTVTLLQRQYQDGVQLPERDTEVTLHFDADTAKALTWRW